MRAPPARTPVRKVCGAIELRVCDAVRIALWFCLRSCSGCVVGVLVKRGGREPGALFGMVGWHFLVFLDESGCEVASRRHNCYASIHDRDDKSYDCGCGHGCVHGSRDRLLRLV